MPLRATQAIVIGGHNLGEADHIWDGHDPYWLGRLIRIFAMATALYP